ncbi:hypothetical protein DPEC_G00070940 [Dallia pectoralis]|uniref:Uncharacterized protein n=1 Tax=Dallia pectoralis TaxID=75939 RepID=A0ACC2H1Z1_DALPE|nr:hypothetical protein DPEC_G00070940 [Dallia pectoralis]
MGRQFICLGHAREKFEEITVQDVQRILHKKCNNECFRQVKAEKMFFPCGWIRHLCLANTINLIVRDAMKVMKPTVDKVKAAVEYFHRSTAGAEKLKATQNQMGMPKLRPKQDCLTRWN